MLCVCLIRLLFQNLRSLLCLLDTVSVFTTADAFYYCSYYGMLYYLGVVGVELKRRGAGFLS